ncbi:MAG: ATP synthase F1 subunit epsilon [Pseudomonadales bacterium]|nr:ATP synthase F1 subunit epsilon [Candidatus Woesebacteria bacterium]MCB9802070.1 ATP synthase F1 subunit epsilon [Pseudomonadales bacterium]
MNTLSVVVVSQEREVLRSDAVAQLTAPASEGEVTILPNHVPLITTLKTGLVTLVLESGSTEKIVVSKGFLTVQPDNSVSIMVDAGTHEREASAAKAEAAIKQAQEVIRTSKDRRELLLAEASLKRALLEQQLAMRNRN